MDTKRLTSLLAAGPTGAPERSRDCPDEHQIAGYVDSGLESAARERLQLHLADCARCLELVAVLCREREMTARPARHSWRMAPQWAAAAVIVLAVPLMVQFGRNLDRGVEGQELSAPSAIRKFDSPPDVLQVLVPGAGSAVDAQRVQFRWTAVAGSPYYDVRIVTDEGDVIVRERVTDTAWQLPAELRLQPGAEYFVHVDAYPSSDKPVSSEHVPFRVSD